MLLQSLMLGEGTVRETMEAAMILTTGLEVTTAPVSIPDAWCNLVGRTFVLGMANAQGQHVVTLGDKRWLIESSGVSAGDRVRVSEMLADRLVVSKAD